MLYDISPVDIYGGRGGSIISKSRLLKPKLKAKYIMYSIVFKYFGGKKVKSSQYVFKLVEKKGEMRVAGRLLLSPLSRSLQGGIRTQDLT